MPFCAQCGAQLSGNFCANCGTGAAASAGSAPRPEPPPVSAGGLTENMAGALCYLIGLFTGILFLVLAPYNLNPKVRFHAFQSIFFNVAWIGIWLVLGMIARVSTVLGFLLVPVYVLLPLAGFGLWLFLMYKAYNNQPFVLPVIGPLAEQQAAAAR